MEGGLSVVVGETEQKEVEELLKEGCDLRNYSTQVEKELRGEERTSVSHYLQQGTNIVALHSQIASCDNILQRMEMMLTGFLSDLGNISSEMMSLQRRSVAMSRQLHNRQAVRAHLAQFIDDVAVPEELIMAILERPVTDAEFCKQLSLLDHKIKFVRERTGAGVRSCRDVLEVLDNLSIKAVTKIRSYLLEQVSKFRRPMTNYQVSQNAMLKHKQYFEFMWDHEKHAAEEVRLEYVDTMAKIYFSYFKSYLSALNKLMYEEGVGREDLMGSFEGGGRSGAASTMFHRPPRQRPTIFTIGTRGRVLDSDLEAPIIIPHSALKADTKYPYEALFRSLQYALVDNACREFLFVCEFFKAGGWQATEVLNDIMGRTLALLLKSVESYVGNCFDSLALFLCGHLVMRYRMLCHKRAVPALDVYWDRLENLLWPRFEVVMKLNIQSVRACDPTKLPKDTKPHYIIRRFAEFSSAIISISESLPSEMVSRLIAQLFEEVEMLLLRMAAIHSSRLDQVVLLINNYDMALGVVTERCKEGCREGEKLKSNLSTSTQQYLEETLSPHLAPLIEFVQQGERAVENNDQTTLNKLREGENGLVEWFDGAWKGWVEAMSGEAITRFPSLVLACHLQQLTLASFLQYYERFHKLLSPQARANLVNVHHIKVHLKKHKLTL